MKPNMTVALVGNPNSGKTTIFNQLTGDHQHVGNYPGVTVERKEGFCQHNDTKLQIIDLPGTYSLSAYSAEELVTRDFIIDEKPDVIVNILDASNLERNLYLAVQLMELNVPLVLVFNMIDVTQGYKFDFDKLSKLFQANIVQTIGNKGVGMQELLNTIVSTVNLSKDPLSKNKKTHKTIPIIKYQREIEQEISKIESLIKSNNITIGGHNIRWLSIKLLENDETLRTKITADNLNKQIDKSIQYIQKTLNEPMDTISIKSKYDFISDVYQKAIHSTAQINHTVSDKIDAIVTNRILGIPVFLVLMYFVFQLTFTIGEPPMRWIESLFGWLGTMIQNFWPMGSESLLKSLLVDGIIGGIGGVIIFLPNILLLFMAIAILEDSGYMARAAFIMDNLMHKIGLHGKSFIPMIIGFGCSVPAIMATRILENRRDRLTTMLVIPLMSCGARLPIYALIIPAFFPQVWRAPILWIIYIIGIILAVVSAKLLRVTVLKGESVPFIMELPPYKIPTVKSILTHMWQNGWLYLKKAGTVILGISILLWAMTTFPNLPDEEKTNFENQRHNAKVLFVKDSKKLTNNLRKINNEQMEASLQYSIAGRIGHIMEPALKYMGFDWKIGTALIGSFAAKEVFVAQMGIVYSMGQNNEQSETLRDKLKKAYTPLIGFCIMLFCLISTPCMATIAVTKRESNSWSWALFQLFGLTFLAYILTVIVFQLGSLLGIGVL